MPREKKEGKIGDRKYASYLITCSFIATKKSTPNIGITISKRNLFFRISLYCTNMGQKSVLRINT